MYTQCPDCGTAFRISAEVLRQAAGKVRCGGCGNAFNALEFLSEKRPAAPPRPAATESLPELHPDAPNLEADEPPETISAEQSAALLKTLDELAGSDIRIEDTGVEWRVLEEDEEPEKEPGDTGADDTGSMKWFIDESPTPVDETLSDEPGEVDAPEIFEEPDEAAAGGEMRFDDDTPLPDDFDFDSEPAQEAPPVIETRDDPTEQEAAQVDLALGDPEDWEDLLGEVAPQAEAEPEEEAESTAEAAVGEAPELLSHEEPEPVPDVDEQFATQAEAMGIDLSGIHEQAGDPGERSIDDDLISAAFEAEEQERARQDANAEAGPDAGAEERPAEVEEDEEEIELEIDLDDQDLVEARDRELVVSTEDDARLAAELGLLYEPDDSEPAKPDQVVLPQSEEEQTVNMMIDQDLLAIAVEDEEGFASTIVQKQSADNERTEAVDQDDNDKNDEKDEVERPAAEGRTDPLVETIIMEGEFIRDANEEEKLEKARKKTGDPNLKSAAAAKIGAIPKADEAPPKLQINYGMVVGIAVLVLLLILQVLHQSRESLATYPAFSDSIGSVYRMIGRPVTPAWDIAGWRFEATKGSTGDEDEVLTIYSRVGNKSDTALPYPLISVSLTDRFEDIIGSKVLEPGEYLAENLDTRRPVEPGNTFSAVISIEAPDATATGFKLNVCYRQPGGRLKCAIDDFK